MAGLGPSDAPSPRSRTRCFVPASLSGPPPAQSVVSAIRHGSMAAATSSPTLSGMTNLLNCSRPARSATLLCTRALGNPSGGSLCCDALRCRDHGRSYSRLIRQASGVHLRIPIHMGCFASRPLNNLICSTDRRSFINHHSLQTSLNVSK